VSGFRVLQIDHVEMFVPDRSAAAGWYERVFGLEVMSEFRFWATDSGGPLMISSDGGSTKLALFEGNSQESRPTAGFHRVAFRVDAAGFMEFLLRLPGLDLKGAEGQPLTSDSVVDHQKAWSIYFSDPHGHRLEVTTYDYESVRASLAELGTGKR
jgi:catechol 2,3-dioxygenase-like lactoylglutathione lyase family enzyme